MGKELRCLGSTICANDETEVRGSHKLNEGARIMGGSSCLWRSRCLSTAVRFGMMEVMGASSVLRCCKAWVLNALQMMAEEFAVCQKSRPDSSTVVQIHGEDVWRETH